MDSFDVSGRLHLVLEFAVCDLTLLARNKQLNLSEAHIKCIMQQILSGLEYMHRMQMMHRDIKPENILITAEGVVKLADFGHTVRVPEPGEALYHKVVTMWYRPPELLFGATTHGPAVDVWSVGCIMAELFLRQSLFPAKEMKEESEWMVGELAQIFRILGTPVDPLADIAAQFAAEEAATAPAAAAAAGGGAMVTSGGMDVETTTASPNASSSTDAVSVRPTLPLQ
ncbi:hypothetical protein EON66_04435, partial [archaeon]